MREEIFRQASILSQEIFWLKMKIKSLNELKHIHGTELLGNHISTTQEELNHIKEYLLSNALKDLEKLEKEFEEL
jgi:predicted RNA-binding protein